MDPRIVPDETLKGATTMTDPEWEALATAARAASANAYVRYSNFRVGAATLSTGGAIASGCNVERAAGADAEAAVSNVSVLALAALAAVAVCPPIPASGRSSSLPSTFQFGHDRAGPSFLHHFGRALVTKSTL